MEQNFSLFHRHSIAAKSPSAASLKVDGSGVADVVSMATTNKDDSGRSGAAGSCSLVGCKSLELSAARASTGDVA